MNRKGAIPVFILIAVILIFVVLAAGSLLLYQKERNDNVQLKSQIEEVTALKRSAENKLDESKKVIAELQAKLQESKDEISALTGEVERERASRQETAAKIEQLISDLEQQKTLRADLENKLISAQDEGKKIKAQLKDLESQKSDLESKVKDLEAARNVELGKVVVYPDAADKTRAKSGNKKTDVAAAQAKDKAAKKAVLEGKVLVVNKEFNFIVFNLGNKDGVQTGSEFSVYHADKYVGDVKVEKVHEAMSAAEFSANIKDRLFENDKVVQKAK